MKKIFNLILGTGFFLSAFYFLIWQKEFLSAIIGGLIGSIFIYKWRHQEEKDDTGAETSHN